MGFVSEILAFVGLTTIWTAVALIASVGSPKLHSNGTGKVVLAFSWINVLTHAMSAGVAFVESRVDTENGED